MMVKVIAIHDPSSFLSRIKYVLKEDSLVFTENIRSHTPKGYVKEFLQNEAYRPRQYKNRVYMTHEILSLSSKENKDCITDDILRDLVREYISLRGEGLYVGAVHRDKEHMHIHLCVSGTQYRTNKSMTLKKPQFQELKTKFQEYHINKYPQLSQSIVRHGSGKTYLTDREWQAIHTSGRKLAKEQIKEIVAQCFAEAKNQKDFLETLRNKYNLIHYQRGITPTGLFVSEIKIRFSRLGIDLKQLPKDRDEEQKALAQIAKIRKGNHLRDKQIIIER